MARSKLKYDESWYYPSNLTEFMKESKENVQAVRTEYTRLRDIAHKRLQRFEGTKWTRTQTYKRNVDHYKKLADIKSDAELAGRLADLAWFIESKTGTVRGLTTQMNRSLKTLHENEYDFITPENFIDFGEFMEEYRAQHLDDLYDSGDAYETFSELEKHRVDPTLIKEKFEFWMANRETLADLPTGKGNRQIKESTLEKRLNDYAKKMKIALEDPERNT